MFGYTSLWIFPLGALTGEKIKYYLGVRSFRLRRDTFCGIGLHFLLAFIIFFKLGQNNEHEVLAFFGFCRVEIVCL